MPPQGEVRKLKAGENPGDPLTGYIGEVATETGLIMKRARITPNTRII